jgi:hypothetical protein
LISSAFAAAALCFRVFIFFLPLLFAVSLIWEYDNLTALHCPNISQTILMFFQTGFPPPIRSAIHLPRLNLSLCPLRRAFGAYERAVNYDALSVAHAVYVLLAGVAVAA